ncbi:MAG TPA: DUF2062 domain-containing protein [Acidobacteriaceae bacterium]|jgi:hypothetical protein
MTGEIAEQELTQGFVRRRVVEPLFELLREGTSPERLAWSLAIGIVIGINPLLGTTTLLALAVAPVLKLNIVASQAANHLCYPLELILFPVFLRIGSAVFRTEPLPMGPDTMFHMARLHPWDTTRLLWRWEWHALVVWAALAVVAAPLIAICLKPVLEKMLPKVSAAE